MSGLTFKIYHKWIKLIDFSPVDAPELDISSSLDSSGSRGSVDQGEFSKAATFPDIEYFFPVYEDLNLTLERNVEK